MNKNYFIIGVSSLVLIVLLFAVVSAWPSWLGGNKNIQFAPPTGNSNIINAHQCNADGVCETNNLVVMGNAQVNGDLQYTGNLVGLDCAVIPLGANGGIPTCANAGYTSCITQETKSYVKYFDSYNSGCVGNIQVEMVDYRIATCTNGGGVGGEGCGVNANGVEPYRGDFIIGSNPLDNPGNPKVLCCR